MAIGPRNRRRLAIVAVVGLAVAGAVVAAVLLTRPATHPARPLADPRWRCVGGPNPSGGCVVKFGGVVYGMSPQQVQHQLGNPTTKRGHCWVYSELVPRDLAAKGVVESTVSECFLGGRLSNTSEQHYVHRHGKLVPYHPDAPKLP